MHTNLIRAKIQKHTQKIGKGAASKIDTELEARKGTSAFFNAYAYPCITCSTFGR